MFKRFLAEKVQLSLQDTRVILLSGPRQAGKTTLAKLMGETDQRPFFSLDSDSLRSTVAADPTGFIREIDHAVIDEVQRVPSLLLAIKQSVDADPRPGRFLLTGSANLMLVPKVADSLAGRMETLRLLPLAQSEILGVRPAFLEHAFAGVPPPCGQLICGSDLVELVTRGGYPEALRRNTWSRRQAWFLNYVDSVIERDVQDVANIEQLDKMPRLLRILAAHAAQLVNYSELGKSLGMNHNTTQKYVGVLERMFLTLTLPALSDNALKRMTKAPKLHLLDAGLLAALHGWSPTRLKLQRSAFGPLLETFVLSELLKLASWSDDRYVFSHYRDKEKNEVDVILEDLQGNLVGVEVKAAATVTPADFSGLRRLAAAYPDRFVFGMVLYDHNQVIPVSKRLSAVPISSLWGSTSTRAKGEQTSLKRSGV